MWRHVHQSCWPVWMYRTLWGQSDKLSRTHTHTHIIPHYFQLRHCPSSGAVAQAGAAALVRDLECRGNRQALRHGNRETWCCSFCKTDRCGDGVGRFIWATVLEQDVDTLLASSTASQSQRTLPLTVPIPNITAILKWIWKMIRNWIRIYNYPT